MIEIDYFAHVPMFCETSAFPDHCFVRTKLLVYQVKCPFYRTEWEVILCKYNFFPS